MKVIVVIQDPSEIRDILANLVRTGRALPGFVKALAKLTDPGTSPAVQAKVDLHPPKPGSAQIERNGLR
jgi:hypothetical protein